MCGSKKQRGGYRYRLTFFNRDWYQETVADHRSFSLSEVHSIIIAWHQLREDPNRDVNSEMAHVLRETYNIGIEVCDE